jgi:hypothetical protein
MKPILRVSIFLYASWITSLACAQGIAGTVTAADTGAPMAGATVLAIQKSASQPAAPLIYRSVADSSGNYAIAAAPGQYSLCVHPLPAPKDLYLDPCQWGSPISATAGTSATTSVPLSLQKGVLFIVRVHDPMQLLPQAEVVKGAALSASLTGPSVKAFPLPVVYSDSLVRDYGAVIPINVAMSATISSQTLTLTDSSGAPLSAAAIPFQVLPTDIEVTGAPLSPSTRMFPPPDAKMIHVYATGLTSTGPQLVHP